MKLKTDEFIVALILGIKDKGLGISYHTIEQYSRGLGLNSENRDIVIQYLLEHGIISINDNNNYVLATSGVESIRNFLIENKELKEQTGYELINSMIERYKEKLKSDSSSSNKKDN